jgi:DNA-binding response OmpR family regulator
MMTEAATPIAVGRLSLEVSTRGLSGPHGSFILDEPIFAALELLAKHRGQAVAVPALHAAILANQQPGPRSLDPDRVVAKMINRLRTVCDALGAGGLQIRLQNGGGYLLVERDRRRAAA